MDGLGGREVKVFSEYFLVDRLEGEIIRLFSMIKMVELIKNPPQIIILPTVNLLYIFPRQW